MTAPLFIASKCSRANDGLVSGDGDENVADLRSLRHGHHAESVHDGFDALVGLISVTITSAPWPFARMATPLPHQPYPAMTTLQPSNQQIRRANHAINRGLSGAVAVVEEMLGLRIIYGNDRILQRAILGHGAQADHAGRGLFGAADDVGDQVLVLGEQQRHQVRAIVHRDCGL